GRHSMSSLRQRGHSSRGYQKNSWHDRHHGSRNCSSRVPSQNGLAPSEIGGSKRVDVGLTALPPVPIGEPSVENGEKRRKPPTLRWAWASQRRLGPEHNC